MATPSSTQKLDYINQKRTWKVEWEEPPTKRMRIEKIKRIPAGSLKSYKEFIKWASSTIFYVAGYIVHVEVAKESDIERNWALGYEYCRRVVTRCYKEFKNSNNLEDLLKEVDWNKLKISDVPNDVPITLKSLATSAKAAATTQCDNTSVKTFIHSLFDLTKIFLFCNSHAQQTEIVHPQRVQKIRGGFEIETMVEFLIADESCSSESESSQFPSNNESSPTSSLEKKQKSPKTVDHLYLTGIPDVVCFLRGKAAAILSAEEKKMQKTDVMVNDSVEDCDAGQLLFYLLSHSIEGIKGNCYTSQAGLYSEGFKALLCYSVIQQSSAKHFKIILKVSSFFNLLSASKFLVCKTFSSFAQMSFKMD